MNMRSVTTIAVAVLGMSIPTAALAAPAAIVMPLHAMFEKTKLVKLSLRNDTSTPMELKVGEDVMTIAAGKTVAVKLAVGTRIVTNATTAEHASGTLLAEVSSALSEATIGIK